MGVTATHHVENTALNIPITIIMTLAITITLVGPYRFTLLP